MNIDEYYNKLQSSELKHHGIEGQKWGVRRFQNKDGSVTPAGAKRYYENSDRSELAKNLANGKLNADVKMKKLNKEYGEKFTNIRDKYRPKKDEWYEENSYRLTKKAKKWVKIEGKLSDKYDNKILKLEEQRRSEEKKAKEEIFLNKDIKSDVVSAREIQKQMDHLENEILGENSKYAKAAYEKFKKEYKDNDSEYAFYEGVWTPGNADYDAANKIYKDKVKSLSSEYDKKTTDIGRKVFGEFADVKIKNNPKYKTYADFGKAEVDHIITYDWDYLKK